MENTIIIATFNFIWKRFNAYLHREPEKAPLQLLASYILSEIKSTIFKAYQKLKDNTRLQKAPTRARKLAQFEKDWFIGQTFEIRPNGTVSNIIPIPL